MKTRTTIPMTLVFALAVLALPAIGSERVAAVLALADEVIIPDYVELQDAAEHFEAAATNSCGAQGSTEPAPLRADFHDLMDAWERVQWLRQGPAEFSFRHQRMQYWPDKHGSGSRQFRRFLLDVDRAALEPDNLRDGSVALQGLPAVERLLFSNAADAGDFTSGEGGDGFICAWLVALAGNIAEITVNLVRDWRGPYREALADPNLDNPFFESDRVSISIFLTQLVTQIELMQTAKIAAPLGDAATGGNLDRREAESWRSGRSLRDLRINLAALREASDAFLAPLLTGDAARAALEERWDQAAAPLAGLADGYAALEKSDYAVVAEALARVQVLQAFLRNEVSAAIDVPLGFNSLDGD